VNLDARGTDGPRRVRDRIARLGLVALACVLLPASASAAKARSHRHASAPASAHSHAHPTLNAMRSWSAPTGTRVVFDFSAPVTLAGPDSGASRMLALSVPGEQATLHVGVPSTMLVRDSAVDSVRVMMTDDGLRLYLAFTDLVHFTVFTLAAEAEKPFRVVVDVTRPGAVAAEDRRLASIAAAKKSQRVRLVAVDAGHGGEDTGARGYGAMEKNVTLSIAKQLADALNAIPGVRAMLTRDRDFFIPLHERYKIAEKAHADMFISIHCNSSRRRGHGSGTEVYFLSLKGASDQADKDLADAENAADLVGGVPAQAEDDMVNVLYEVKRSSMLERSQLLAETLLDHMAAFAVLKSVEFPSVLVETAFINNPHEVKLLKDPAFQQRMAQQLSTGIKAYFSKAGVTLSPESSDSATGSDNSR